MNKIHAWMTEDGRVIPADSRDDMPRTVRDTYCIPLGKIAASASAEPIYQVRKVGQLKWQDIEEVSMSMYALNDTYVTRTVYAAKEQK